VRSTETNAGGSEWATEPEPAMTESCLPSGDDSDDLDWSEIAEELEEDERTGRNGFFSEDYPTEEAAMKALEQMFTGILEEVLRDTASEPARDSACL
jgi:hypothetical protein